MLAAEATGAVVVVVSYWPLGASQGGPLTARLEEEEERQRLPLRVPEKATEHHFLPLRHPDEPCLVCQPLRQTQDAVASIEGGRYCCDARRRHCRGGALPLLACPFEQCCLAARGRPAPRSHHAGTAGRTTRPDTASLADRPSRRPRRRASDPHLRLASTI